MARTPSNMLALKTVAPDFILPDTVSDKNRSLDEVAGEKGTMVMFICNHCPYVIHVKDEMVSIANEYQQKGIGFVAISSNDVENYPADSPEKMKEFAAQEGFSFPYLYDETQSVARAYEAACTPDFYLFDSDKHLYYRGRMDASRPGNQVPLTGKDLRTALDSLLSGKPAPVEQHPSMGCNIKWKRI
ncbi:MAG: thioredoxin family protein [Bacteroidota bacterium]